MLNVPSGLRYQPSKAGVTVWPLDFGTASGNWARVGDAAAAASAARPRPPIRRARIAVASRAMRSRRIIRPSAANRPGQRPSPIVASGSSAAALGIAAYDSFTTGWVTGAYGATGAEEGRENSFS